MPLNFILTNAGKAAIIAYNNAGTNPVVITQIAIGSAAWSPTASATALTTQIKRIAALGGGAVADDTIHVTGSDSSADVYIVREVGLYTSTNVLLAVYSQVDPIITKGAATVALLAADLVLTGIPAGSISVGDVSFSYPPATELVKGVAEIATTLEAQAGVDDTRFLTPKKMQDVTATIARKGVIELATDAEVIAGIDTSRALTPSHLAAIKTAIFGSLYPVGEILITRREGSPATWLGFGTWVRHAEGRTLVGYQANDSFFDSLDETGGAKTHTLNTNEMPSHTHASYPPNGYTDTSGGHNHSYAVAFEGGGNTNRESYVESPGSDERLEDRNTSVDGHHAHNVTIPPFFTQYNGSDYPHNNMPPYIVAYIWKRTA